MPGYSETESAWATLERLEHWQNLFSLDEDDIQVLLGPRVDRETGDWFMDAYARYDGEKDMSVTWNAKVSFEDYDLGYDDVEDVYSVWRGCFEEELGDAELYFSEF